MCYQISSTFVITPCSTVTRLFSLAEQIISVPHCLHDTIVNPGQVFLYGHLSMWDNQFHDIHEMLAVGALVQLFSPGPWPRRPREGPLQC